MEVEMCEALWGRMTPAGGVAALRPARSLGHLPSRDVDRSLRCTHIHRAAPEIIMGNHYDVKVDVYAFGVIMWSVAAVLCVPAWLAVWRPAALSALAANRGAPARDAALR